MLHRMATFNRAEVVDKNFLKLIDRWDEPPVAPRDASETVTPETSMTGEDLVALFESQIISRHLDLIARALRAHNASFYTIGSSGHEGNALVGRLTRASDPAMLHYRSGGFMAERTKQPPASDFIYETVLSLAASADDPVAGGRHKVWGSRAHWVMPQTSTIASHLPKAVGAAIALGRVRRTGIEMDVPPDGIVVCSFGDASLNHSTAVGALNAARWSAFQKIPTPILFVCEDNGTGISVRTPPAWVDTIKRHDPEKRYFDADGLDIVEGYERVKAAVGCCRKTRMPVFLHLRVVRLLGHAGTDLEAAYRTMSDITDTEARDPLLQTARRVIRHGFMTPAQVRELYEGVRRRVLAAADKVMKRPRLESAAQVVKPLAPFDDGTVNTEARRPVDAESRVTAFGGEDKLPEAQGKRTLSVNLNSALYDLMVKYPETFVFGEDVAQKGGVYYVTAGLHRQFKSTRVFNTLLDEQTILGMAQGIGLVGGLPLPEIQYLAYFHNACDQLRGEACSTQFFSNDQFRNPMVVRIASLGYQKGFGGHFHNDNSITALRDIPGLVVACPSRGDDAAMMLRTCVAMAKACGRVVAFLEPIALYKTKDLHEEGDEAWSFEYPHPKQTIPFGMGRVYFEGATDLAIITYGNGVPMALRAAKTLREEQGIHARIVDLRWLSPLNEAFIATQASSCDAVLVLDEGRRSGGVGEAIVTAMAERCERMPRVKRVTGVDTYIPLGPAANLVLPQEPDVVAAATALCGRKHAVAMK